MTYLLIANFSLLLFYLLYILLLKGLTFFQWNRIYLLGTLFLSYMLPLLAYIDVDTQEDIYNTLPIVYTQTAGILVIEAGSSVFVDQVNWYWVIYGLSAFLPVSTAAHF